MINKYLRATFVLFAFAHLGTLNASDSIYSKTLKEKDFQHLPAKHKKSIEFGENESKRLVERFGDSLGDQIIDSIKDGAANIVGNAKQAGKDLLGSFSDGPMLMNCFMSPTKCAVAKDARRHGTMVASITEEKIRSFDQYLGTGEKLVKEEIARCIPRMLSEPKGPKSLGQALERCMDTNRRGSGVFNYGLSNDKTKPSAGIIAGSLEWAGVKPEGHTQYITNLMKNMLGDTKMEQKSGGVEFSEDYGNIVSANLLILEKKRTHSLQSSQYLQMLSHYFEKNICRPILSGKLFTRDNKKIIRLVEKLETPYTKGILFPEVLKSFASIAPENRSVQCRSLSNAVSRARFSREMSELISLSGRLLSNPKLSETSKGLMQGKINMLRNSVQEEINFFDSQERRLGKSLADITRKSKLDKKARANRSYEQMELESTAEQMHQKLGACSVETGEGCI